MTRKNQSSRRASTRLRTADHVIRHQCEIRNIHPGRILIIARDIGKDVHVLFGQTANGEEVIPPTRFASLESGLTEVTTQLDALLASGQYDLAILGHEPTSIYHPRDAQ